MEGLERGLAGTVRITSNGSRPSGQVFAPYRPQGARGAFRSFSFFALLILLASGCTRLFGWDIHAPGILSHQFVQAVQPAPSRVALYLPPELLHYESKDRGSWSADPQTYYVGEALGPMLVEAFQNGFEEFILLEAEPTPAILQQYAIPKVAVVRIKNFRNLVTWHGQVLALTTETALLDQNLNLIERFESTGKSASDKIFSKRGGPEVNLNAVIENNVLATIQHLQDMK